MAEGAQRTPQVFSQLLVGRYLLYGHDALAHCQTQRDEKTATLETMDAVTAGMAKVLAFLFFVCRPFVLPAKIVLIELSSVLEKHRYDDPVGVAFMFAPNAFGAFVMSCVIVLVGWLAVKGGKRLLHTGR